MFFIWPWKLANSFSLISIAPNSKTSTFLMFLYLDNAISRPWGEVMTVFMAYPWALNFFKASVVVSLSASMTATASLDPVLLNGAMLAALASFSSITASASVSTGVVIKLTNPKPREAAFSW